MRERLKRKQLSAPIGILSIVLLLAVIIILSAVIFVIADYFNIGGILDYAKYLLFIIIGVIIIRKWITEYEYVLVDNELFIDRYIGKRPRRLLSLKLTHITYIGKRVPDDYSGKIHRLTYKSKRSDVTYIVYIEKDQKRCAYFSPSDSMLSKIQSRLT